VPIIPAAGIDSNTIAVTAASPPTTKTPIAIGLIDCDTTSLTMSRGVAPSAIRTPISFLNFSQPSWVSTTTARPPSSLSACVSVRPRVAVTPSMSKKLPETNMPRAARPLMRVGMLGRAAATSVNTFVPWRIASYSVHVNGTWPRKPGRVGRSTAKSSSGFRTASTRKKNMLKNVKATVTTPRPSAIVETTVSATSGVRRKVRSAKRTSRASVSKKSTPLVAALVRRERYRAEACARVLERLRGIDAGGHQLSRFTLDMKAKLVVELPLDGVGLEDGADAELETAQFHDQASFMTRSIAADIRSHSLASTAS